MRLRSLLFAPAERAELLRKLPRVGADAVVLDCEDGTSPAGKDTARANAREVGAELAAAGERVWVRVNAVGTDWFADDIASAIPDGCAGVVLPVAETTADLDTCAAAMAAAGHDGLPVLAGLETARGVLDARELLDHDAVVAGYFGAEDLIADVGGVRTTGNEEVAAARAMTALAARVAGVPLLDMVTTAVRDDDRFAREARQARDLGYAGKLCIHPAQVTLAHAAFTPSDQQVAWARRVLAASDEAGGGVAVVDGAMVDGPLVAQANRILTLADDV